jgi:SNF2 family DNA or RNA helicase
MNDRPSDASSSVRTTEVVSAQNDELWSDSEEDMDTDEPSEKQSAKSTNRKRTNIAPKPNQNRQAKRDSKETTKLGGGWRLLLSEGNTFDTHQKKESDEDAERKLFPQLEGAVFSLDKLEPFPLPTESIDAKQYTIPAALNRYLKAYQREGISFLYSAVIKGSGAILGDDMGLGEIIDMNGFALFK